MNSSLFSADRYTHIKIVMVSLAAVIALVTVAMSARISGTRSATVCVPADGPVVVRAGKLTTITANDSSTVR
jgi:hypothetical protein